VISIALFELVLTVLRWFGLRLLEPEAAPDQAGTDQAAPTSGR
jgi:hypothetical protein